MRAIPHVCSKLISELEALFPDTCPRSDPGAFGLGVMAGRQQVIDFLKTHHEKQKDLASVYAENPSPDGT